MFLTCIIVKSRSKMVNEVVLARYITFSFNLNALNLFIIPSVYSDRYHIEYEQLAGAVCCWRWIQRILHIAQDETGHHRHYTDNDDGIYSAIVVVRRLLLCSIYRERREERIIRALNSNAKTAAAGNWNRIVFKSG